MRIKKLEVLGFKSFADKACLTFGEGITGVVGPNGCGKSNVVDAIRWCMGEMSAKHLRGRAMQDVIFAGSQSRGPLGLAEVTLTFDNDGDVPPSYLQYAEIAVTRRLHRDGTSEYLLNNTQVRLQDITDLFLGTGVGTRAYSIIEQGRIGFVVNSKPEERRTLIEEVAGITKFKARKKAAERRMESTELNLQRVQDVIGELERQLVTLRRQAKKAQKYQELSAQLRDVQLHAAVLEWLRLTTTERVVQATAATYEEQLQDGGRALQADESSLEAKQLNLLAEQRQLQEAQSKSAQTDATLAALERDVQHWQSQLQAAQSRSAAAHAEVAQVTTKLQELEAEHARISYDCAELQEEAQAEPTELEQAKQQLTRLQQVLREFDQEIEALRAQALRCVEETSAARNGCSNLKRQHAEAMAREQDTQRTLEQLLSQQTNLEANRSTLANRVTALAQNLAELVDKLQQGQDKQQQLKHQSQVMQKELLQLEQAVAKKRSRWVSLQEITQRLDGYSDGVRTLLKPQQSKGKEPKATKNIAGILDLVAQVLEVPPHLEPAVEAVLGEKLQYLVVQEAAHAQAAIDYLVQQKGGRGGFIPLAASLPVQSLPAVPDIAGVVGPLLPHVVVQEPYQKIAAYLLAHILVVDNLQTALHVQQQAVPGSWTCVSLQGDVVKASGVVVGGVQSSSGLLANRREIRELESFLKTTQTQLDSQKAAYETVEQEKRQLAEALNTLVKQRHATELARLAAQKDHEAAIAAAEQSTHRLARTQAAIATQQAQKVKLEQELQVAEATFASKEQQQQAVQSRLPDLADMRQQKADELNAANEALTAIKVHMAAHQERATAAVNAVNRLSRMVQDLQERKLAALAQISQSEQQVADLTAQMSQGKADVLLLAATAQEQQQALSHAREQYEAQQLQWSEQERLLKEQRRSVGDLQETLLQYNLELQKLQLERQNLTAQVLQRHDVHLLDKITEYHLKPLPDARQKNDHVTLEQSIKALGSINLTAIEECATVEARHGFLVGQRDDLQEALTALKQAIGRINKASRERFGQAFTAVNDMFQKVYPRLFRGGSARLELTHSDDLLEAGVDIIASPPGKKLQSVGLLSGGEKALTATALVFSIFLIKPSPFCILDEVDAPLDEANVGRFNELLREIAKVSQFIVITHNKQTMLQADKLYGITMQEPGMSKVVAVDLNMHQGKPQANEQAA